MSRTNGNIVEYSTQYIDNKGFNTDTELKSVEIGGTDGSTVNRLKVNSDGSISVNSAGTYDIRNISPADDPEIATYKYFGFLERGGTDWRIMRKTIATKVYEYASGTTGYSTAWTNKDGQSYS